MKRKRCDDCGDIFSNNNSLKRHKSSCSKRNSSVADEADRELPVDDEVGSADDINLEEEVYIEEDEIDDLLRSFQPKDGLQDIQDKRGFVRTLVIWTCLFLCLWQSTFYISSAAVSMLLQYIHAIITVAAKHSTTLSLALPIFPTSIYMLHKLLKIDRNNFQHYVVCPTCHSIYKYADCVMRVEGEEVSRTCPFVAQPNHPKPHFRRPCLTQLLQTVKLPSGKTKLIPHKNYYYKSLEDTLNELVNRNGFRDKCEQWRTRKTKQSTLYDIYDGKIWREFSDFFSVVGNYGLMLNIDWFQPFKHVQYSVGVMYMVILNLPREERFKRENIILIGVIPHMKREPLTNTFVQPLVEELMRAWSEGFTLGAGLAKKVHHLALICIGCDIPACRKLCGFLSHAAVKGCSKCHKEFPGAIGKRDYSGFDRDTWEPRTHEEHVDRLRELSKCTTKTQRTGLESAYGARYSVLSELPYIDLVRMSTIDPMHNLFMGTAKHMLNIWKETGVLSDKDFNAIQERVDSAECPSDLGRIPRKIASGFSGFTADQFKSWTNLFSIFALKGIISDIHLNCWRNFVMASRLLCCRAITLDQIKLADSYLMKFCVQFERIYGKDRVTPNMHLHAHLMDVLLDFGPVYSFWLFSFERFNGIMGDISTNMKNIELQLVRRFLCHTQLLGLELEDEFGVSETLKPVIDQLTPKSKAGTLQTSSSDLFEVHLMASRLEHVSRLDWTDVGIYKYSKYSLKGLTNTEEQRLTKMYQTLYGSSDVHVYPSVRHIKSITFGSQMLGSLNDRTSRSSFITAYWTDDEGDVNWTVHPRPGQVVRYLAHTVKVNNVEKSHLLAEVRWFLETPQSLKCYYGQPIEAWDSFGFVDPGASSFMPVQRIKAKFVKFEGLVQNKRVTLICSREQFAYA